MYFSPVSRHVSLCALLILFCLLLHPVQAAYIPPSNQTETPTVTVTAEQTRYVVQPVYRQTLVRVTVTATSSGTSAADAATGANITQTATPTKTPTDTLVVSRAGTSPVVTTVPDTESPTETSGGTVTTRETTTVPPRMPKGSLTTAAAGNATPAATLVPTTGPAPGTTANATAAGSAGKNLPLSWLIPDALAPVAAVVTGVALTGLAAALASSLSGLWDMILAFLKNVIGSNLAGRYMEKEKEADREQNAARTKQYPGFSRIELLVLAAGAVILGLLFLFADRKPFDPALVALYVIMGGVALVLHELGHIVVERKYGVTTQVRFWGTGTVIMALTAWLFGSVFAQPYFTGTRNDESLDRKKAGLVMLAGPGVSVVVALLCLALVPLGGIFATAGILGCIMNLMTAVFEMLPIIPCEGKTVFSWKPVAWACFFIPVFIAYIVVTMQ